MSLLLLTAMQSAFAKDYGEFISEQYLRSQFVFSDGENLKYAECKKKSQSKCTYVWGVANKKDAKREKMGLAPSGNKLMIIYAQGKGPKDFQRVLTSYSDAKSLSGLGKESVWSTRRKQLSLLTDTNLIIHININIKGINDHEVKARAVAKHVLNKL